MIENSREMPTVSRYIVTYCVSWW